MSGFRHDIAGGDGNLIATSVQSPNFVTTVSGWQIDKSGHAEFNDVVIRGGEVVGGSGLFYSGAPGPGDLIASIAGGNVPILTDPYGNTYFPGVYSYAGSKFAGLAGDGLNLQDGSFPWQLLVDPNTGYLLVQFPHTGSQLYITNTGNAVTVVPQQPSNLTPETWHAATLANSWTGNLSYRYTADPAVWMVGTITPPGSGFNGTFTTLPSGYLPASTQDAPVGSHSSAAWTAGIFLRMQTSGVVGIINGSSSIGTVVVNARIPLDL